MKSKETINFVTADEEVNKLRTLQALCLVFDVAYRNTASCRVALANRMLKQMCDNCQFDENGVYSSFGEMISNLLYDALKRM